MSEPRVLNKRDGIPSGSVYVGRPSKFGNPFHVGKHGTRVEVIEMYRAWFLGQPALVKAAKNELCGKDLVCWCAPQACHADILLEEANKP